MKKHTFLVVSALALASNIGIAHAQRQGAPREERREQRQQLMGNMTPEQRTQRFQERWQERYNNASPEQKQRMDAMRQQMNQRLQDAGIDPNAPDAFTKAQAAGVDLGFGGQGGEGGRGQGRGGRNGGFQANPARDERLRATMIAAGIVERPTQDAIIGFVNQQERSRAGILRMARAAANALIPPKPQVRTVAEGENAGEGAPAAEEIQTEIPEGDPEVQLNRISETFETYAQAVQEDRVRYGQALQDLNNRINFMENPRVRSFLSLTGILEYDALSLGGISAIFPAEVAGVGNPNPTVLAAATGTTGEANAAPANTNAPAAVPAAAPNPFLGD